MRCPPSITYEDEVDRRVFVHPAESLAVREHVHNWLFSLSAVDDQASRTSCQESHQTLDGLLVLGIRLLHPSRKFLHRELQLAPVLTEIAGPYRPRSVTKLVFQHQAPCHPLRKSSEHQEYSLLCFRYPVPSVIPRSPRHEGRPPAPIARVPLRLKDSLNSLFKWIASCTSPISLFGSQHSCRLDQQVPSQLISECVAKRPPLNEKSSLQRTTLTNCTRHAVFASKEALIGMFSTSTLQITVGEDVHDLPESQISVPSSASSTAVGMPRTEELQQTSLPNLPHQSLTAHVSVDRPAYSCDWA